MQSHKQMKLPVTLKTGKGKDHDIPKHYEVVKQERITRITSCPDDAL